MKERIYIDDWLWFKPYDNPSQVDNYYLQLCNDVNVAIRCNDFLLNFIEEENYKTLACFLTSYFEDIISGTNIWNTFVKIHKRLYKKQVPFYNLDSYYEGEINQQDVSFLIWYFLNTIQEEDIISPLGISLIDIAVEVMKVLEGAWEYAPENENLKSFYQIDENEDDFYVARNLIETVLFQTYLFFPDIIKEYNLGVDNILEEFSDEMKRRFTLINLKESFSHNNHTCLLSLKGKEWVAELLGEEHPLSKDYTEMSEKILAYFLYKGQDLYYIYLEHIASGMEFKLLKKSYDDYARLTIIDTILLIGLVRWKGEWWFSGAQIQSTYNQKLIDEENKSRTSRIAVNFLEYTKEEIEDRINTQFHKFKAYTQGKQIVFMPSNKINGFMKSFTEFWASSEGFSSEKLAEIIRNSSEDYFHGFNNEQVDFSEEPVPALIFFNPKNGIEMVLEVNSAFPMSHNPYFNAEESYDDILDLFIDSTISVALTEFCVDNFKDDLLFFKRHYGKWILKDMDFMLRFWKNNEYHSRPYIGLLDRHVEINH